MADEVGVSQYYVDSAIARLESQIDSLRDDVVQTNHRIDELEQLMKELVREMIAAIAHQTQTISKEIGNQTIAIVGGVVANTTI